MDIEHDPREPKYDRSNRVFYFAWFMLAVVWALYFLAGPPFNLMSFCLGAGSMFVLVASVTELAGNHPLGTRPPKD